MAKLGPLARDALGIALFTVTLAGVSWHTYQRLRPADRPDDPVRTAMADFQDGVYYPARAALAGVNPYDARPKDRGGVYLARFPAGNNFPVYAPLLFVLSLPLAILPLTTAALLYWLLNVGLLLLFSSAVLRLSRMPATAG